GFRLRPEEARELGELYRRASADLCRAQARTANAGLLRYLNDLVARAYGQIYSGRKFRLAEIFEFFAHGFPAIVRARWRAVALSTALVLLGGTFGFVAASVDEDARHFLLPEGYREIAESLQMPLQHTSPSSAVSSIIMTNNIRVCFWAFALGI